MTFLHHNEFAPLFGNGGVALMAQHGFIRCNGNQVSVEDLHSLVQNLDKLKADPRSMLSPMDLAAVLACPVSAVFSVFCRKEKGTDKHNVRISRYDAHNMLTRMLDQRKK